MNFGIVKYALGKIMLVVGALMAPSLVVALIYGEGLNGLWPFVVSMAITLIFGYSFGRKKPKNHSVYAREGFVIVALTWVLLSFFGSLPFIFSGAIPHPMDAFFETVSGFTTTGSSILTNVEALSPSILWWRSFTHWIGGMGILVFAIAVFPKIDSEDVYIMKAEVPGPIFGKVRPRLAGSARILYLIYTIMTVVLIGLLILGGMPVFDSCLHAFGAAGTGGFGIKNSSVAFYDSAYIDYVLAIAMILFGINFNLHYALIFHNIKDFFKSEELKWYLWIILLSVILISLDIRGNYESFGRVIRDVFFTVSSIITTTGFATADFGKWPVFSQTILLLLMFVGAMAGSTAGGLKVSRVVIYVKSVFLQLAQNLNPDRRKRLTFEGKAMTETIQNQTNSYLSTYILIFVAILVITSLSAPTFLTSLSAVAATFNNIGPGLDQVGPTGNFSQMTYLTKFTLSIGMIMGRLEIFPVLVLFHPKTWSKR